MKPLTARQRSILNFLRRYIDTHGYAPTLREIGDHAGLKTAASVASNLARLEERGHLTHGGSGPRIRMTSTPRAQGAATDADLHARLAELEVEEANRRAIHEAETACLADAYNRLQQEYKETTHRLQDEYQRATDRLQQVEDQSAEVKRLNKAFSQVVARLGSPGSAEGRIAELEATLERYSAALDHADAAADDADWGGPGREDAVADWRAAVKRARDIAAEA